MSFDNKKKYPLRLGEGFIYDKDWIPMLKTYDGWVKYLTNKETVKNKSDNKFHLHWTASVVWVEQRNCFRGNFAAQPFNISTGR
jgi:hypothetical protein